MKVTGLLTAFALTLVSATVLAVDDPEMSYIDTTPDNRVQPPEGINTASLVEAIATITAIDMEKRLVTIEGPDGDTIVVKAGDKVKNLSRVEVVFVDPVQKFISVRDPDRGLRKISLKESPDLQHYLKELKEGDVIQVTYTDAMAIEVVPAD